MISGSLYKHFNSQPHKEADLDHSEHSEEDHYFNSQPHKEADDESPAVWRRGVISTHSLTRRLTSSEQSIRNMNGYFNSQPHKEADAQKRKGS